MAVAGLLLGPPAHAQSTPETTTNTPAADAIGPRELQGFSLPGTVTRPADQPPPRRAAPPADRPATTTRSAPATTDDRTAAAPVQRPERTRDATEAPPQRTAAAPPPSTPETTARAPRLSSLTVKLPAATDAVTGDTTTSASPGFGDETDAASALASEHKPLWPWLLAAMALGAGGALLFFRNRSRSAYAGGPQIDAFVTPEPPIRPRAAVPPHAPPPASTGIVSTRLRPWIDLSFEPARCIVEDDKVRFEFELGLYNSGSTPARDVLIEAVMVNASPTQEQEIGAFFGRQDGAGDRISTIPPLKRVTLRPQVIIPLEQVRVLEAAGRRVFVPLIAFNALYGWGGGAGQTAAVYLLGRDTKAGKMAPFRLDLGPRVFRGVGARALPNAVRS